MIKRFYVNNFRCLEGFELPLGGLSSVLLIGKNGTGKTTVGRALEILQSVARGTNRVGDLIKIRDFANGRTSVPMRFDVEVELDAKIYQYTVAFELPEGFKEPRVLEEKLSVAGSVIYSRDLAKVRLVRSSHTTETTFSIDWHLVALPLVYQSEADPLHIFRQWLARMLILRPVPSAIRGDSEGETLQPNAQLTDFGAWFSGLLALAPSSYGKIEQYLKEVMPDLADIKNPLFAKDARSLEVQFSCEQRSLTVPFAHLSDGEKCFLIYALVMAANNAYGPLVCFWDEPDNYLAPSEVSPSITTLRRAFEARGQLIATSHNPEAIRRFSDENTLVLHRENHLEPVKARLLREIRDKGEVKGDIVSAIIRGDLAA